MNVCERSNRRCAKLTSLASYVKLEAAFRARRVLTALPSANQKKNDSTLTALNALLTNNLLSGLPTADFERLLPHIQPVNLTAGDDLRGFENGVAYFPETAVVSQLHSLGDGNTTEAIMIGREGVVGLSAIFDAREPRYCTRVLISGSALTINRDTLKQEFSRGGTLQRLLLAYAGARIAQVSRRAVCSGRHSVEERFCCWLLMIDERAGHQDFQLTHRLIANHLGVRRAGITQVANALRDKKTISYSRGIFRIVDQRALIEAACECFLTIGHDSAHVLCR